MTTFYCNSCGREYKTLSHFNGYYARRLGVCKPTVVGSNAKVEKVGGIWILKEAGRKSNPDSESSKKI